MKITAHQPPPPDPTFTLEFSWAEASNLYWGIARLLNAADVNLATRYKVDALTLYSLYDMLYKECGVT